MKRLLFLMLICISLVIKPVIVYGEKRAVRSMILMQLERVLELMPDSVTTYERYATTAVNVYYEPDEGSSILRQDAVNTPFQVTLEANGWSVISGESGLAYVKSEYLSDVKVPTYSEEELYIMAHLLAGEVQGYSDEEQLYVGSVVLNRVNHPSFPNTIKDVVFQRGQYACTWDGNYNRTPTERNWANARYLLENGSVLPGNVVWQSRGKQGKGVYIKTSVHYYCY